MVVLTVLMAYEYLAVAAAMPVVAKTLHGEELYALAFRGSLAAGVVAIVGGGRWNDATGPLAPIWTGVISFMIGLAVSGIAPNMEVFIGGRLVGDSVFSVVTVAVTGALLTALGRGEAAYVACFGLVVLITLAGTAIAGRYAVRGPERPGS